jgi:hypothetical protein
MKIGNLFARIPMAHRTILLAGMAAAIFLAPPRTIRGQDAPPSCNYYASPTGSGNGTSPDQPFRVSDFWRVAKPGATLCLADGTYRGDSMISPPRGVSGRDGTPITVRALHDGKVLVDGEGSRKPVALSGNDWFVVAGVNACCSSESVVEVLRSNHSVIRRVVGWDAADGNHMIFGVHFGEHNLLEDVAGWGIARKVFSSSQQGNFTTVRRAWGRWEGSHVTGPKSVYSLAYNNYNMLIENAIGTWSGERMKESYVLLDYDGKPWTGRGGGTYQNHDVNQPYAIFGMDVLKEEDKKAKARLFGSLAYVTAGDAFKAQRLVFVQNMDAIEIADVLAYIEPGSYPRTRTFDLYGLRTLTAFGASAGVGLSARNITSIGGAGIHIGDEWQTQNVLEGPSPAVYGSAENAFHTTRGANLCYRYVDGVRTTRPLWPWPMNQRIKDALVQSGRQPVDVTATVEKMLGKIPQECREPESPGASGTPSPRSAAGEKEAPPRPPGSSRKPR